MNQSSSAAFQLDEDNPGAWVVRQCADLGVPIAQVAAEAGVDRATIHRWRSGESSASWGTFERVRNVIREKWTAIETETSCERGLWRRRR